MLAQLPSLTAEGIGVFPDSQHVITVSDDAKPRAVKLRPVPLDHRQAVEKEIEFMVEQGSESELKRRMGALNSYCSYTKWTTKNHH